MCHLTEEFIFKKKNQLFKRNHTANIEILSYLQKDPLMIRAPFAVLIPQCSKPLSKVALPTQKCYADNEQDKFNGIQF